MPGSPRWLDLCKTSRERSSLHDDLGSRQVLTLSTANGQFVLDTDASAEAIGGELCQVQERQERTIAYWSFTLSAEKRKCCTSRTKLLAVIWFTCMYRHYLLGRRFAVRTGHYSFILLLSVMYPQDQLAR